MRIEVWADVVCPWCYIGKRRLEAALAESAERDVEVVHRAFQLDPGATTDGERTVDVLASRYRVPAADAAQMMAQVTQVATGAGLHYRLLDTLSGNTRDAHRLVLWAQHEGSGAPLLEAVMHRYFEQAAPIFTAQDLLPIVAAVGLDPTAAAQVLAGRAYDRQVEQDQHDAAQLGARGVPFFVVDRALAISGAQPVAVLTELLRRAAEGAATT